MSEIPELPPLPRQSRPLPPGGLESAMTGGRRRRNRFLGAAGGTTTALALVVAALVTVPGDRNDSLQFADPEATASASPQPDVEPAPQPSAQSEPSARSAAEAESNPEPEEPQAARGPTEPEPQPETAPGAGAQPAEREPYVEAPQDVAGRDCGQVQDAPGGFNTNGRCMHITAPSSVRRGESALIVLSYCVSPLSQPDRLAFRGGQEHELRIRDNEKEDGFVTGRGAIRWTWSSTLTFTQGAHERMVQPDRCLEWTTTWDTRDAQGQLLPPGSYFAQLTLTSSPGLEAGGTSIEVVE